MARQVTLIMALLFAVISGTASAVIAPVYSITPVTTSGGTIIPAVKQLVPKGNNQDFNMTANSGYYLSEVKVDGIKKDITDRAAMAYAFSNVSASHRIAARFVANPTITATANAGGSITPLGKTSVEYNGSQSYDMTPDTGYDLVDVKVDGVTQGPIASYGFSNVIIKHRIAAKFRIKTYNITASAASSGGRISPASITAKHGTKKVFTVVPAKLNQITSVTVNGVEQLLSPVTGVYKLTLEPVTGNIEIVTSFDIIKVAGLPVANQVSVVDAKGPETPAKAVVKSVGGTSSLLKMVALSGLEGTDYDKDKTNVYVNEKSGEAFKTVNMILCMVDQTKYSDSAMVNHGYYKAMVNSAQCQGNGSADNSGSSAQSGTSASAAPSYDIWTVKSDRISETSNHTLTAYIHTDSGPQNEPMTIQAKMVISAGVSAENPLGIFTMNYRGTMDANPSVTAMRGVLKTQLVDGKVVIRFAEIEGPAAAPTRKILAAYTKDDFNSAGHGSAYMYENYGQQPNEGSIDFAYDAGNFRRVDPAKGKEICLDRTKFETSAWRYGLYDAVNLNRAALNGGFSINTQADGKGYYGYLGYYGLNLPPNATPLGDGSTVYKMSWDNGSKSVLPYTLSVKGGKLKKHTRSIITLDDIKNIPLEGNIPTPGGNNGPGNTMYRLSWDGNQLAILASAEMSQMQNGPPVWTDQAPPTVIDSNKILPFSNLGLYSQALGGQLNIQMDNCTLDQPGYPNLGVKCATPTGATSIVFYKESTVYPTDTVPATLACYDNCPQADSSGMNGSGQNMMTYQTYNTRHDYAFTDMLLMDGINPVVLATTPPGQSWGFNSGALFDPANISLLACDWDNNQTCGWKAWNALDEFYTWETGPNSWNRFTAAKDPANNNLPVVFDAPKQVEYTHHQADATANDFKYDGTRFFLQYSGFGDLQGIPGRCVNPDDPSVPVTDCSQPGMRWVPEFTIPADSTAKVNGADYLIKPLDVEQRMAKSIGGCTGLAVTDMSGSFPNMSDWVNPALPIEPVVTDPPRVIGGVVQAVKLIAE